MTDLNALMFQTPCGHNFCLKCFQKWIGQGKRTCAKCRSNIPSHMASQPRINSALVATIRRARMLGTTAVGAPVKVYHSLKAEDLPDESYVTERAKYGGIANAKCGRIFVSVPSDHFGPILAENDPVLNLGVLVGQCFANRHKSRQWGVHRPLVCGISGQANVGAQSVVLSGGYVDDEDHGEWFLYTGRLGLFIELYSLLNILVLPNLVYGSPSPYFCLRSKLSVAD